MDIPKPNSKTFRSEKGYLFQTDFSFEEELAFGSELVGDQNFSFAISDSSGNILSAIAKKNMGTRFPAIMLNWINRLQINSNFEDTEKENIFYISKDANRIISRNIIIEALSSWNNKEITKLDILGHNKDYYIELFQNYKGKAFNSPEHMFMSQTLFIFLRLLLEHLGMYINMVKSPILY